MAEEKRWAVVLASVEQPTMADALTTCSECWEAEKEACERQKAGGKPLVVIAIAILRANERSARR